MLGPGIFGAATPFAFSYSLFARARASNRPLSYAALVISAIEVILVVAFIVTAVVQIAAR